MAINKSEISVIIPTLNEEEAIGEVILDLYRCGFHDILVVDGYSEDRTREIALKNGAKVIGQHGFGKGMALKTGIEQVNGKYILVIDGDCTYDPMDMVNFLQHVENYDEIIGVRVIGRNNIPIINRFGNWIINKSFNFMFGTKLKDVCSGMYILRTDFMRKLNFEARGFDTEVEIAAQAAKYGKLTEVPISYKERVGKKKLSSLKNGFQILNAVFRLAISYNPISILSAITVAMVILDIALFSWVFIEWLHRVWDSGLALLGAVSSLFTIQVLTTNFVIMSIQRMEQRLMEKISKPKKSSISDFALAENVVSVDDVA